MNKIATRQYVANLTGGNTTDEGNRCATKKWVADNYPDVIINGGYADNQLVCKKDMMISYVTTMTSSKSNITLRVSDYETAIIDWGDGMQESIANKSSISHTYSNNDIPHNITITGKLTYLSCPGNQLTSLDVKRNTALINLNCGNNELTSLDVSKSASLLYLNCNGERQLTSLDVTHNTALISLGCNSTQLTSLDVSQNTALTSLSCVSTKLTSLDVTHNTALTSLNCDSNQLTSLDVSKNLALTYLNCDSNKLSSLDVSQNGELTNVHCTDNPFVTDESALKAFANTLPQREASSKGTLYISNNTSAVWIQSICDAKNWGIR